MVEKKELQETTQKIQNLTFKQDFNYFRKFLETEIDRALRQAANEGKSEAYIIIEKKFDPEINSLSNIRNIVYELYTDAGYFVSIGSSTNKLEIKIGW